MGPLGQLQQRPAPGPVTSPLTGHPVPAGSQSPFSEKGLGLQLPCAPRDLLARAPLPAPCFFCIPAGNC